MKKWLWEIAYIIFIVAMLMAFDMNTDFSWRNMLGLLFLACATVCAINAETVK